MSRAWITAGFPFWGHLREMSARLGTRLEESKGLLRRTFTFHGTDEQIKQAYAEFEMLKRVGEDAAQRF